MTQTPEVSKSHQTGAPSSSAGLLSSSKLTFRQQEVFDLLVAYINQHGYPPTLSELADMLAVQLLQEMIAEEPGARERAIEFLRLFGDQP